jgi:hypothetical protein
LTEVLHDIALWRERESSRRSVVPEVAAAVLPGEPTFAAHQKAYMTAASAVVALIGPLATWLADHPGDREAADLHARLVGAV